MGTSIESGRDHPVHRQRHCAHGSTEVKKQRFKYPSVTEILQPYVDLSMVKAEVLELAKIRGTIVHAISAGIARFGIAVNTPQQYQGYVKSFQHFHREIEDIEMIEERIFNDAIRCCGQPDLVAKRYTDRIERVWDIKTPVAVYPTWKGQIAMYKWLYEQKTGRLTDMPGHIRLRENGNPPIITLLSPEEYETELRMFFSILTAYHHYV